jgi:hypothetical protein
VKTPSHRMTTQLFALLCVLRQDLPQLAQADFELTILLP